MDESQILQRLRAIGEDIATGKAPQVIFDAVIEAVQALDFDRVRLDLLSLDGTTITPAAWRGFGEERLGGPILASDDPDVARLTEAPRPQVGSGERGLVPLLLRGRLVGKLVVENGGKPVSRADLDTLVLFAQQAAFAQTMLWTDSLESLQQTTIAITSERDRRTLLNRIVEQAVNLLGAKTGGLYEYRPELEELTVIAAFNRPYESNALKLGEGMAERIIKERLPHLVVLDYNTWEGRAGAYMNERSFGAVLEVPLRWEESYLGVLYVDDEVGRTFSDTDIHLLRLFADQAAICLANSNLLQSDAKKLKRLEDLAIATQEMMGNLDEIPLRARLDIIARHAAHILDAETAGVFLVHGEELFLEASYGHREGFGPAHTQPLKIHNQDRLGLTGWIAYHGKPYKAHGEASKRHPAVAHNETHAPSGDCYSLLALPLMRHVEQRKQLVGLIRVDNKKGEHDRALDTLGFSQEDEWILTIFAEAALVAIEGAELVDRLSEQSDFRERLISSSPAGIIAVDRKGQVTEFNKRAEEILGFSREEILGKPVAPLYLDKMEPLLIGKKLHEAPDHHTRDYLTYLTSKEGEAIPIRHSSTWLFDAVGERVGSVGYFVDLRSQRLLERRERLLLRASKVLAQAEMLDDGLQRITEMMVSELGRSFCGILLMDESGNFLTLRAENLAGDPAWRSRRQRIVLSEWPGVAQLLKRGRPWAQEWSNPENQATLEKLSAILGFNRHIDMLLAVPLKIGDRVVGQLDLGDLQGEGRPAFSQEEEELASALASQVAGLIQRFQLLETTARREKLLQALVEASPHIHAGAEITVLQQVIVRLAAELVGCRIGGLFLNRPHLRQLELAAVYGAPEDVVGEHLSESEGLIGTVAKQGETTFSTDPQGDLFRNLGLKSVVVVPLRRGSGEVQAVLFVGDSRYREHFSRIDLEILDAFATQATIALDTARLMDREQLYGRQMATLHRISDYIQGAESLEEILHSVLTGITATYGLGFNRAVLMLVEETGDYLVGEMGIGELEEDKAHEAWKSAAEVDDFERYLRQREKGIPETTIGRRIRGLRLPVRESGVFSEVLASGKYQHVPTSQFDRIPPPFLRLIRARTPLEVAPLTAKGQVIGILVVDNKFTQEFVGEDLSNALMTFASTAAVAIENKRLLDQTRSGAEKLLSFYQMSSELIALSDPREILRKIVAQIAEVAGAPWVSIVLIDSAGRAVNAIESGGQISLGESATLLIRPEGLSMRVMNTGQALPIENVAKVRDQVNPVLMRRSVQAAICLPMSLPGKRVGVMWIYYNEPHRFPESEVAALQLYVNQAAIAYESSRRTEILESIRETSTALALVEDMRSLLERIVQGARRVLKADEAVLWLYDAKTDIFVPESSTYAGDHPAAWSEFQKSGLPHRGTAYHIMDRSWMSAEDIQEAAQREYLGPTTLQFLQQIGARGFQGVALKVGREKLGVLYAIYLKPCRFDDEERETAFTFASHAAVSLKKAKLFDQLQRAREAAEVVARVTLLEDPKHTLLSIVHETKRALDCGAVVLYQYDEDADTLIPPMTVTGLKSLDQEMPPDRSLILAMIERDNPYVVQNVAQDERFKDSPFAREEGIKSLVAVPLRVAGGRRVGVLFVNYRNPRRFTADDLTNIELFANQAAVAIRNIQLFEESTTKLKQQEALAELSRELLLAKSVQDTMDCAVEFAARVLETDFANIVLPDRDGRLVFSAAVGWPREMVGNHYLDRGEGSQTGYTIRKREPVVIYNFGTVTEFRVPEIVFEHGIQSGLSAPMFLGGTVVGAMLIHTKRLRRFTEDDGNLLSLIANQTAFALERARQYETSWRRSRYLEALYDVAKTITAQTGMEQKQILEQIVPNMVGIVGLQGPYPILGSILLYNDETNELIPASVHPPERQVEIESRFGKRNLRALRENGERVGISGRAVLNQEPQLVRNVKDDLDFIGCPPETLSELAVPLIDAGKVIGVLNVESEKENAFDEEDEKALKALAELVVVALLNARRLEELGTQTALAWMGLGNAVTYHELNNHVGTLKVLVELLKDDIEGSAGSAQAGQHLQEIDAKLRELSVERPAGGVDEEISSVLVNEELIETCERRTKDNRIGRKLEVTHRFELESSARVRGNGKWLHRVLDIFIKNAHDAGAMKIVLGSRPGKRRDSHAEIYVEDDGRGFPEKADWFLRSPAPRSRGSRGMGTGLLIAQSIAQIYGGFIYREARTPHGTLMILSLPLEQRVADDPESRDSSDPAPEIGLTTRPDTSTTTDRSTEEIQRVGTDSLSAATPLNDEPAGAAITEEKFRGRILMVDDDQTILTPYSNFLERKGYHVTTAVNLEAAKLPLGEGAVDLLITDLRVKDDKSEEDISGFEFAYPFSLSLPIIVFTGHELSIKEIVKSIEGERQPTAPRILVVPKKGGHNELLRAVEAAMESHYPAILKPVQREKALAGINTAFYIPRAAEVEVIERLQRMEYLIISEPRQQGKTSLVSFLVRNPPSDRMIFSYVDVSGFHRSSAEAWIETFRERVRRSVEQALPGPWYAPQDESADLRAFLVLLGTALEVAGRQLVIAMDEVDPASSGLRLLLRVLREVYNSREFEEAQLRTFAFLFLGTFYPEDLVAEIGSPPFNITQRVRLPDFDVKETTLLVRRRVSSDVDAAVIAARVFHWAGGQPYLTQMLCNSLRDGSEPDEIDKAAEALRRNDRNHFPLVTKGLLEDADASTLTRRILSGERIRFSPDSSQVHRKLEMLGVIPPNSEGNCRIRNRLCEEMLSALFGSETVMSKEEQPRRRRPKGNRGLPRKYRVLFLAAEPAEGGSIWIDREMREVQQHTKQARRPVTIIPQLALRLRDLNQAIFDANAQIIHFSGHGSSTGDLYFEDDMKRAQLFETAKLAVTLPYIARNLKCVVLNACFSARQAESVAQRIEYVIGMKTRIESEDAVTFSRVFYEQLGFGKSFEDAFQVARVQSWSGALPERLTDLPPVLFRDGELLNLDEEAEAS